MTINFTNKLTMFTKPKHVKIQLRAVMLVLMVMFGVGNAWADHSTHYGKAVLQNATGNGTVYLSTASGSNSGQTGSSNPGSKDGTSWITWDCGGSSGSDSKTYYARGTANAGYYYAGWATSSSATSYTAATTGQSFSASGSQSSPTTTTIYGFFKPVTVTGVSNVTIDVADKDANYPAEPGMISFTTANSNALTDFTYTPAAGTTGKFTFADWTRASATSTTVKYQFKGDGTWGGVTRTITQNVTLTSKGTNGGSATCTITVNYPNVRVVSVDTESTPTSINATFKPADATQAGVGRSAVFNVEYCDGTNNFDTPTFTGAGASHFTYNSMTYANGKLTVNYTYNGNKEEDTHVATLTLKGKDAIGGTDATYGSKSVTITAENAPEAADDAKVIASDGVTNIYQGDWATALSTANDNAGCTLKLLRNVTGLTASQEVKNTMTLDLASYELSGTLSAAGGLIKLNTEGKILTINDSYASGGGKISVSGNIDGRIAAIEVLKGSLVLTKGDLLAQNANTGTTLANIYAAGVYLGAGTTMGMTGGSVTANRTGASGNYCFGIYCADTGSNASSVNLTGGTVTATFPNGSYAEGVFAAGNSIISNMTVTASSKTTCYAIRVEDGHLAVNGGIFTATTTNQEARGLYSMNAPSNKNAVVVNNATFNVTAGTTDARGIWCRSTTTTMTGDPTDANVILSGVTVNAKTDETTGTTDAYAIMSDAGVCLGIQSGTYTATTKTQNTYALHTSGYTAVVDGTFNANSTTRTAFAIYVNGGITAVKAGTFTASAATAEVHATKILANAKLLTYGGTFRGVCNNVASDGWATGSQVMSTGTLEAQGGTFIGEVNKAGLSAAQTACACGVYANTGSNVAMNNATLQARVNNNYLNGGATTTYYGCHGFLTKSTNSISLTNCTISSNSEYQYAYGIRAVDSPLEVKNCTITVNSAQPYAYGIYTYGAANVKISNSNLTVVSQKTTAYGSYVANGSLIADGCTFDVQTKQTGVTAAANNYLRGIYVASGKNATLVNCTILASGNATCGKEGYGLYVDGSVDVDNCTVTVSNINTGAYAIYNSANTTRIGVASGKFKATATSTGVSCNNTAAAGKQYLYGGYYNTNNNLEKYLPAGYSVETLPDGSTEKSQGYNYAIRPCANIDPVCKIGTTPYTTLEEALEFVNKNSGTSYTILMIKKYTLPAGDYILPKKATLLVPRSDQTASQGTTAKTNLTSVTRSKNLQLTFAPGVNMVVSGVLETGGELFSGGGGKQCGYTQNSYGVLELKSNSHVVLEDGSKLICWGYVIGEGKIDAKSGSELYENFELAVCKGGSIMSGTFYNAISGTPKTEVFPVDDYFYQNIESEITYWPGAKAFGASSMNMPSGSKNDVNGVKLVGATDDCLFTMSTSTTRPNMWIRKKYNPQTDRCTWTMNDGAQLSSITIKCGDYNIQSVNHVLPIASNMDIVMNNGLLSIASSQRLFLMPGSRIIINKDATLETPSNATLYVYDVAQWNKCNPTTQYVFSSTYQPDRPSTNPRASLIGSGDKASKADLPSAEIFVHGTLLVKGSFQTTEGGAYIHSTNEDAGQVVFEANATATGSIKQYTSGGSMVTSSTTSAKLQNGDGTYESTVGSVSGDKWIYRDDKWVKVSTSGCFVVETISGTPHYYAHPKDWVEVAANSPDDHAYHVTSDPTRFVIQGADCNWIEVIKDGSYYKCINENSIYYNSYFEWSSGNGYWVEKKVTIKFNDQGTETTYSNIPYKSIPKYEGATPNKSAETDKYYTWIGWTKGSTEGEFFAKDAELPEATENTTYYALFESHKYSYAVTFKNYDGSVLQATSWEAGQVPYYLAETDPVKPATAALVYTFTGWSPAFTAVTGSGQVYTAQFDEGTPRTYTVQWVNYDGTVLKSEKVAYNATPSAPTTPTRPNDAFYTYTFNSWTPAISAVTGNQTYTAMYDYSQKVTKYNITFKNGTTTMYTQSLPNGETPVYGGSTPAKDEDAQYTYTFDGWSATEGGAKLTAFPQVNGAAQTYYALFTHTTRQYTIRWKSEDGKQTLETDYNVPYGTTPSYDGATPTKPQQGSTVFTFDGWSATKGGDKITLPNVTGHATYYAHFSDDPVYTVTFDMQGHGTAVASQEVVENQHVIEPAAPAVEEWIFGGWYKESACTNAWNFSTDAVTANTALYAKWTQAVATVTANNETVNYATLADAITAANGKTDATVKMIQNASTTQLTISAAMTLNLNGKTITSTQADAVGVFKIDAPDKKVTVTDSGTNGKINHTANYSGYLYGIWITAGTLDIQGGTIYAENTTTTTGTATRAYGIFANGGATAKITMSNGKIEATCWDYVYGIYSSNSACEFKMTGGEITATGTNSSSAYARGIYVKGQTTIQNNATITANGGTDGYAIYASAGSLTIEGGRFKGSSSKDLKKDNGTVSIKGGYYVHNTDLEANCATNHYVFALTEAEKEVVGNEYNYKVVEAYTVTWNENGGELSGTYTPSGSYVAVGDPVTAPTATKTGYNFSGWDPAVVSPMTTGNKAYTATWTCADPSGLSIASDKWDFCAGETMTLSVSSSNSNIAADASYQWAKDGVNITGATTATYTKTLAREDAGTYTCTVTNGSSCSTTTSGYGVKVWTLYHNVGGEYVHGNLTFSSTGIGTITLNLAAGETYEFKLNNNMPSGNWYGNTGTMTTTIPDGSAWTFGSSVSSNCHITAGIGGSYVFKVNYSDSGTPKVSVTYPTANQPSGSKIYFDKSIIGDWGDNVYYRIGKSSHNSNQPLSLVAGTDQFYEMTTNGYDGFEAWQIANNTSWSGDNSIYKVDGTDYAITKATNFQKYVVDASGITIVPTTSNNTENGCNYWNVSTSTGMLTHMATITTPTNGTITISNVDQSLSATATTAGIPHRTILTITATPNSGYRCTSLTVNGETFTSGSTHILAADATIAATFESAETGSLLDIVDWTTDSLTINANGWAAAGWPYKINNVDYGKDKNAGQAKFRDADRTLTIPYSGAAGSNLQIKVQKTGGDIITLHSYKIPFIGTTTGAGEDDIVYVNSGTLTISANTTLKALIIRPEASVNITSGTLTVDSLVLRTLPWQAASINGNFTATKIYYTRIAPNKRTISGLGEDITYEAARYYQFALPLNTSVALKDIKVSHNANTPYGNTWLLKRYDEPTRATQGASTDASWVALGENDYIQGGVGYEMFSNSAYYREFLFPVTLPAEPSTTVSVSHTDGAKSSDEGWNAICSPLMGKYNQIAQNAEELLKVSDLMTDGHYWQHAPEVINPAVPFYYQAAANGSLDFSGQKLVIKAPRRAWNTNVQTQWLRLTINDEKGKMLDETNIYTHPDKFGVSYETGYDVAKQSLTGGKATIYTEWSYGKMAFAAIKDSVAGTYVPVTVYAGADKEYTFSMIENNFMTRLQYVLLFDTELGMVTDLLSGDYTCDLTQGTTAGRFYLQCVFAQESSSVTTGADNVSEESRQGVEKVQKIMYKDKVYIIYEGRVYDMTGRQCELQ